MSRLIDDATKRNTWGSAAGVGVNQLEPQRSDLWYVDFTSAVLGVNDLMDGTPTLVAVRKQLVQSVSLPENRIKVEPYRRDSIPFNMPSWDETLDAVKMTFIMDTNTNGVSTMQQFLENWLEIVRAGRGQRSSGYKPNGRGQPSILLDENYTSVYRFDCFLSFLRGNNSNGNFSDLEVWQTLRLQQAYVSGIKVSDVSYSTTATTTIDATFFVESIDWLETP